jgi:hypothetical protein
MAREALTYVWTALQHDKAITYCHRGKRLGKYQSHTFAVANLFGQSAWTYDDALPGPD